MRPEPEEVYPNPATRIPDSSSRRVAVTGSSTRLSYRPRTAPTRRRGEGATRTPEARCIECGPVSGTLRGWRVCGDQGHPGVATLCQAEGRVGRTLPWRMASGGLRLRGHPDPRRFPDLYDVRTSISQWPHGDISVPSGSMEPTIPVGSTVTVNRLAFRHHAVRAGDIIVFANPPSENCGGAFASDLIKRVIGLPGQTISLSGGYVFINGKRLHETWLPASVRGVTFPGPAGTRYDLAHPYRIPHDDYFVMGTTGPTPATVGILGRSRRCSLSGRW